MGTRHGVITAVLSTLLFACGSSDDTTPMGTDAGPPAVDAGPECANGTKDGVETDVDCGGGTCADCVAGDACLVAEDCIGGVCESSLCGCPEGYEADAEGLCQDVDECTLGTDDCHVSLGVCTNTDGAFTCACTDGYTGDGVLCDNMDECTLGLDDCDAFAVCTDTDGGYTCECPTGGTGDGTSCAFESSCMALLGLDPSAVDGIYRIDPDGATGATDPVDVYCDMTTRGGGWQLLSVVRSDDTNVIVGAGFCTDLDTVEACKGQLDPSQVSDDTEVIVRDLESGDWVIYDGFSGTETSALRYMSLELTLDASADCGASDNVCADITRDPGLRLAGDSSNRIDYTEPLTQWWRQGGWWVGANPNAGTEFGRIHATRFGAAHDLRSRPLSSGPSQLVSAGHQAIFHRQRTCANAALDGTETAVDCGGICGGCDVGLACGDGADCTSGVCDSNICGRFKASCAAILVANAAAPDGPYTIDLDGSGALEPIDVYCDMTTDGGGWQLISVARRGTAALIVGAGYCVNSHPMAACKGQIHPQQVLDTREILVRDWSSGDWMIYAGFSASATSGLRYFSLELTLDGSSDCGTVGDNTCFNAAMDPALRIEATSGHALNYNEPLTQWWRYGGWWVGASPQEFNGSGLIHATSYAGSHSLQSRTNPDAASAVQSSGHQQLFMR